MNERMYPPEKSNQEASEPHSVVAGSNSISEWRNIIFRRVEAMRERLDEKQDAENKAPLTDYSSDSIADAEAFGARLLELGKTFRVSCEIEVPTWKVNEEHEDSSTVADEQRAHVGVTYRIGDGNSMHEQKFTIAILLDKEGVYVHDDAPLPYPPASKGAAWTDDDVRNAIVQSAFVNAMAKLPHPDDTVTE